MGDFFSALKKALLFELILHIFLVLLKDFRIDFRWINLSSRAPHVFILIALVDAAVILHRHIFPSFF